jgi:hypothetical protein
VNFWVSFSGGHTITVWKITATVNGNVLSGTISRVENLWEDDPALPFDPVLGRPYRYTGQILHYWTFSATRIR